MTLSSELLVGHNDAHVTGAILRLEPAAFLQPQPHRQPRPEGLP